MKTICEIQKKRKKMLINSCSLSMNALSSDCDIFSFSQNEDQDISDKL